MSALIDKRLFLENSPYESDAGELIGKDPRQILLAEIRLLEHPESPLKAIRSKCLDCSGANAAEIRKCTAFKCALWPMRMGGNPFHASSASAKREAANCATSNENGPAEAATSPDHGSNNSKQGN
ncbi:hypothetical protein [Rhizobium sp. TRM95796]|uniref:hypothetical protein n=1 Tax=Rhizobium sp. TRM95796 TaxID=2979862 RepID=UPI0021E95155|nr:hypothetical protein [Rhizobium sp. TRM95796]MCV3764050.1 hypothetical protein [Rhizobium sp. TRM95796]